LLAVSERLGCQDVRSIVRREAAVIAPTDVFPSVSHLGNCLASLLTNERHEVRRRPLFKLNAIVQEIEGLALG